jgi:hypothetical protein
MHEFHAIPGYLHVSGGNYSQRIGRGGFYSITGLITDGDLEAGVLILGFMVANWGFAIGVSWRGLLGD